MPQAEYPLRRPGEFWRGIVLKTGVLELRSGEILDARNVWQDLGDTIEKRRGFIRGYPDLYSGKVTSLPWHRDSVLSKSYLLTDADGLKLISGFVPPTPPSSFPTADGYPNDNYNRADVEFLADAADKWVAVQTEASPTNFGISANRARIVTPGSDGGITRAGGKAWFKPAPQPYYKVSLALDVSVLAVSVGIEVFLRLACIDHDTLHTIRSTGTNAASYYEAFLTMQVFAGVNSGTLSVRRKLAGSAVATAASSPANFALTTTSLKLEFTRSSTARTAVLSNLSTGAPIQTVTTGGSDEFLSQRDNALVVSIVHNAAGTKTFTFDNVVSDSV